VQGTIEPVPIVDLKQNIRNPVNIGKQNCGKLTGGQRLKNTPFIITRTPRFNDNLRGGYILPHLPRNEAGEIYSTRVIPERNGDY
jgi:hypothetical protein